MDPSSLLWLVPVGAATGFAAGLLGIGGGMLLVPFLAMLLPQQGVPDAHVVKVAIATSLTTILFTSLSSVRGHHRKAAVRWDVVRRLTPGILVGSAVGAQVAGLIAGPMLALVFAGFVSMMATQMLRAPRVPVVRKDGHASDPVAETLPGTPAMLGMGGLIGAISALVGAGGGFLTVPFLASRRMSMQHAVGTSAACGFPIALAGALGYVFAGRHLALGPGMAGYLHLPALLVISATSMLTAQFGVRAAHALPTGTLRRVFAVLLYALAAYMLWRGVGG